MLVLTLHHNFTRQTLMKVKFGLIETIWFWVTSSYTNVKHKGAKLTLSAIKSAVFIPLRHLVVLTRN